MPLFSLTYEIKIKCQNCGYDNKLKVKKGTMISEFVKSKSCKCQNCGCKIEPSVNGNGKKSWEYSTQWIK